VFMASTYAGWLIEANLQALNRIADAMAEGPSLLDGPQAEDLQDAVSTLPGDVHLWVFDAAGDPVVSSESLVPASVGDRLYFQQLRDGATWTVGTFVVGQVSGRSQFPIARRIERDGQFAGAVISFVPDRPAFGVLALDGPRARLDGQPGAQRRVAGGASSGARGAAQHHGACALHGASAAESRRHLWPDSLPGGRRLEDGRLSSRRPAAVGGDRRDLDETCSPAASGGVPASF
jgi:hypothetical protein